MEKVEIGKYVSVHYTGTLSDGEIFDSSQGRAPLTVKIGAGQLIAGFEAALMGMSVGENKTFTLDPDQAYGVRDENLTKSFERNRIPDDVKPEVGQTIALQNSQGGRVPARVTAIDDHTITVDLNHPMAGKALTFTIEVMTVSDQPVE